MKSSYGKLIRILCYLGALVSEGQTAHISRHVAGSGSEPLAAEKDIIPYINPDFEISTQCGDVLTGSQGRIEYTSGHLVGQEYCSWILKSDLESEFTLDIRQMDVHRNKVTYLTISTFSYGSSYVQNVGIDKLGKFKIFGNVAVISFYTSSSAPIYKRLFVLEYISRPVRDMEISRKSVQASYPGIEGGPTVQLKHPATDMQYDNRELTLLLFGPPNWVDDFRQSRFEINTVGLDPSCGDTVSTFYMNYYSGFYSSGRVLCNETTVRYDTFPLYAVVFKSDNATTGAGFSIKYDWGPQM